MPAAATRIDKGGFIVKTYEIDRGIRRICQPTASHLPQIVLDSFAHSRGSHRCGKAYHEATRPLKRYSSGKRSRGRAVLLEMIDSDPSTPEVLTPIARVKAIGEWDSSLLARCAKLGTAGYRPFRD